MRNSLTFFALGGLLSYLGFTLGGWWHFVHWFSFSCFALAAGYAGLGPRIFGKRSDGRFPVWSRIIHFPFMLYTETVWQLRRIFSRENPFDQILDNLIIGRRPRAGEIPAGISNCVDLTAEMEDPREIRESSNYVSMPILDTGVPPADTLRLALTRLAPGTTFVHCAQGHGRAGLFALALLAERGRIQCFDEGMSIVKSVRPGVVFSKAQERFIRDFIANQVHQERAPE
jgi:protein-tyrosine phosphatase